jgi:hypothetical protein
MLEEREQRRIRPVQVLEHEHRRPLRRDGFAEPAPGCERLFLGSGLGRRPHERRKACQEPGSLGIVLGDRLLELGGSLRGRVRLEDAALGLHDLAQRPERDPVAVGKAASLPPARQPRLGVDVGEQFGAEPALPHARLADHRHELAGALLRRAFERADQQRLLELAPDERRRERPGHVGAETRLRSHGAPERKGLRLALHRDGLQSLPLEHALGSPVRLLGDRHPVHRRDPLQPRGRVHDVAGHQPLAELRPRLERHHRLARVDSHARLKRERGICRVQLLDRLQQAETRPHGPLGVVLVRDRRAEHRHHGVADELLHRAAEPLELLPQPPVIRPDPRPHVLGIGGVRRGRVADKVAEQDGDDLPLLPGRRCLGQRRAAERAEREFSRQFLATGGAACHRPSLGRSSPRKQSGF